MWQTVTKRLLCLAWCWESSQLACLTSLSFLWPFFNLGCLLLCIFVSLWIKFRIPLSGLQLFPVLTKSMNSSGLAWPQCMLTLESTCGFLFNYSFTDIKGGGEASSHMLVYEWTSNLAFSTVLIHLQAKTILTLGEIQSFPPLFFLMKKGVLTHWDSLWKPWTTAVKCSTLQAEGKGQLFATPLAKWRLVPFCHQVCVWNGVIRSLLCKMRLFLAGYKGYCANQEKSTLMNVSQNVLRCTAKTAFVNSSSSERRLLTLFVPICQNEMSDDFYPHVCSNVPSAGSLGIFILGLPFITFVLSTAFTANFYMESWSIPRLTSWKHLNLHNGF